MCKNWDYDPHPPMHSCRQSAGVRYVIQTCGSVATMAYRNPLSCRLAILISSLIMKAMTNPTDNEIMKVPRTRPKYIDMERKIEGRIKEDFAQFFLSNPNVKQITDWWMLRTSRVTYSGYHRRLHQKRGLPSFCEHCKTTTATRYEWANISGHFEDVNDYKRLCKSCHSRFDRTGQYFLSKMTPKKCKKCGKEFNPITFTQVFCGSKKSKIGCSYINHKECSIGRYFRNKEIKKTLKSALEDK